jgi:hypothetical protein
MKHELIFQTKIVLNDVKPLIWRRFAVDADILLPDLHKVIQTVMGWTNTHLHHFVINGQFYSSPDEDALTALVDYRTISLNQVVKKEGMEFVYEYDFGDCWEHTIVLEKKLSKKKNQFYPICFDGERSCPPEDCGGSPGYKHLLEVLGNPNHEEYAELKEWVGDYFDPEEFDLKLVNKLLKTKDYGIINYYN